MKKLLSIIMVVMLPAIVAIAGGRSDVKDTNVHVNDDATYTFESGSSMTLNDGSTFTVNTDMKAKNVVFTVETDTNTTPSNAGEVIMDSEYNLFISTVAGGDWYKITRSTVAGTLGQ